MIDLNERFIVDTEGKRVAVVLDIEAYQRLLDRIEDWEDVQAYDAAKAALATGADELIPWEQAKAELEAHWDERDQTS